MLRTMFTLTISVSPTQAEVQDPSFSTSWAEYLKLHSMMDTYQPRVMVNNCFSVSAFFSFLLIAVNTVVNVSTNNNNNNNNNNDNNLNVNNFMLMPPRKREFSSPTSPILSLIQSTNSLALSKLNMLLQSQPNCSTIVKCDLLALVVTSNPPPLLASLLNVLGPEDCAGDLHWSLFPM